MKHSRENGGYKSINDLQRLDLALGSRLSENLLHTTRITFISKINSNHYILEPACQKRSVFLFLSINISFLFFFARGNLMYISELSASSFIIFLSAIYFTYLFVIFNNVDETLLFTAFAS